MAESIIGEESWSQMTEAEKTAVVRQGRATLRHLTEGLLDGPEELREACRDFLAHTGTSLAELPLNSASLAGLAQQQNVETSSSSTEKPSRPLKTRKRRLRVRTPRQRFGLPDGFIPRLQRYGRMILLEENIYRLPNGQEFIPCHPTGTLGRIQHLYALLTGEQYGQSQRGSVYIRTDGRIFDYSFDHANPEGEIFDTGYTIYNLERTGRYAERIANKKRGRGAKQKAKAVRASAVKAGT